MRVKLNESTDVACHIKFKLDQIEAGFKCIDNIIVCVNDNCLLGNFYLTSKDGTYLKTKEGDGLYVELRADSDETCKDAND